MNRTKHDILYMKRSTAERKLTAKLHNNKKKNKTIKTIKEK